MQLGGGLAALEVGQRATSGQRDDGRDRLHAEGLSDLRGGIHIHIAEQPLSGRLLGLGQVGEVLAHLLRSLRAGGAEQHHHRHLGRAHHQVKLEVFRGDRANESHRPCSARGACARLAGCSLRPCSLSRLSRLGRLSLCGLRLRALLSLLLNRTQIHSPGHETRRRDIGRISHLEVSFLLGNPRTARAKMIAGLRPKLAF